MKVPARCRTCNNCVHYFVNANWEKLCVDRIEVGGRKKVKVRSRLGIMGDTRTCDRFEPDSVLLSALEQEKKERAAKRKRKKEGGK